jgi:hypothetical protein
MANPTVPPATPASLPPGRPEDVTERPEDEGRARHFAARRECDILYSNWLATRAALFDPKTPEDAAVMAEWSDRCDAAARALLVRPSALPWMIWRKWEVLESLMTCDIEDGPAAANLPIAALGCIKADILRFGLKHE